MENHIKAARIHFGLSLLYGAGFIVLNLFFITIFIESNYQSLDGTGVFFIFFNIIFGGLFILHFFASKGARKKKKWARFISRAIATIMLFAIPVGTLIGVYIIYCSGGWYREIENDT